MANSNHEDHKFIVSGRHELPGNEEKDFSKSVKLEWLTAAYLLSVVVIMYLTMSSSQAMKAAWLEDILSSVPAISFLVASRYYNGRPNYKFPYGYHRVFSIAFQLGAFALFAMGLYIFYDSVTGLLHGERPSIGSFVLWGRHWWMGYLMIGALLWSSIPAIFIGRAKLPLSKNLHNKILHVDAKTQQADWQTAFAGILGIVGVGFGWWWADSAAACFISLSVIKDGVTRLKAAVTDLIDQVPTNLENDQPLPIMDKVYELVKKQHWVKEVRIRMREAGEIFFVELFVLPSNENGILENMDSIYKKIKELDWKIHDVVIIPVRSFEEARREMLHQ